MSGRRALAGALDLRSFILRSQVLGLYRDALRAARQAPLESRAELRQQVRNEFETFRHERDPQAIRFFLSDGLQKLKDLKGMLSQMG
ncbi:hypothetical protein KFL_001840070 [Klebsormidium nitens]|uniref:LYR motif-containing protein 2 n=1 Tax=Klebsormidium nitens TaxID=105231 RepID=A0A1Y1I873_KLENI|nr:hypothetical protein KFL_001840070 [Klebsormidium nitens]|eukprot:GAQ84308.1 hypothetical protein KFL_001840070 [Klebsormidium nitens]